MTADQIQEQINANSAEQSQLYADDTLDSYAKTAPQRAQPDDQRVAECPLHAHEASR